MKLPARELIVLRSAVTVVLSLLIAQAGWAAAFRGQSSEFFVFHQVFAVVTVIAAVLMGICFAVLHRAAGRLLLWLAAVLVVMIIAQYLIGMLDLAAPHIFLGVLTAMTGTALTSWTYRHRLPGEGSAHV